MLVLSGYHNAWNQRVQVSHPCLWVFIRHLKDAQTQVDTAVDAAQNGERGPPQSRKWRLHCKKIKRLQQRYSAGAMTLARYWRAMSHLVAQ